MRKAIIPALMLLASSQAYAGSTGVNSQQPVDASNVGAYFEGDRFQWTDYDSDLHILSAFAVSTIIAMSLEHYAHWKPWQAALAGTLVAGLAGTVKEVMFDTYTSRTDIKCYWGGAIAGGLTFTVMHF